MTLSSFLRRWFHRSRGRTPHLNRRTAARPVCEPLEDRCVPAMGLPAGVGAFEPGGAAWFLRGSASTGVPDVTPFAYGGHGWVALAGDFSGSGVSTPAAFDPATATWYVKVGVAAGAPDVTPFRFGGPGWVPLVGDWTGTGHAGIGVYDPATSTFYLRNEVGPGAPDAGVFQYGAPGWVPLAGDWNGNGTVTVGVFNPATAAFYLRNENSGGTPDAGAFAYGAPGWTPVVGDWDGNGTTTVGVFDPSNAAWLLKNSNAPGAPDITPFQFGGPGWQPLAVSLTARKALAPTPGDTAVPQPPAPPLPGGAAPAAYPDPTASPQDSSTPGPRRLKVSPPNTEPIIPGVSYNPMIGSQNLQNLAATFAQAGGAFAPVPGPPGSPAPLPPGNGVANLVAFEKQFYVFNDQNDVLVRVRLGTQFVLGQAVTALEQLGMTVTTTVPAQDLVVGYLPLQQLNALMSVPGFLAVTPVYAATHAAANFQGDTTIDGPQFRAGGTDGTGITVGVISDSVNQVDSHVDANPDKGIAESQRTGALPSAGVNVLQDGSATDTDEGRGMLEIVHHVAPGAKLAFTSADQGPAAMAQGILDLANKAGAGVIVDDVSYPDEPFFNDGLVTQAVDQAVNQDHVVYVAAAGNQGNNAWADAFRPVTTTVGGLAGTFENFTAASGQQQVLQHFSLPVGQTLDLSFQWDAPFLEGGSPLPQFQVPNSLAAYVLDGTGSAVLHGFADVNQNTGEALQRVIFTNNGSYGTNDFSLAFQLVSGPAPTQLKWIRFDNNAPAQYQGAPAIWGHAGAQGALTVGAAPYNNTAAAESFTSQGKVTILFDASGHRLASPEVRNKPDVAGPDAAATANFPAVAAGQSLPAGTYPVFTGTSAAAAYAAGAAALLQAKTPAATPAGIDKGLIQSAHDVGAAGWDVQTGAGLIQLAPAPAIAAPAPGLLKVGTNIDVSGPFQTQHDSTPTHPGGQLLSVGPNVDTSQKTNNEWEEEIAIDPLNANDMFVASNQDTNTDGLFGAYSTDGGSTWTGRFIADGSSDSLPTALGDPTLSWDGFGNLFLGYLNSASDHAEVALSTDGGKTFTKLGEWASQDQPKVRAGANSVWVLFNNNDVEAVGATVTGLGSVGTFGSIETVSTLSTGNFGDLAISPTGAVLVSFQDANSGSGPDTIRVAVDADGLGAGGFSTPVTATSTNVGGFRAIPAQPTRTIDADGRVTYDTSNGPHRGRAYLDYVDAADTTTNDTNIYVRYSDDNGATWSSPVKVNDDKTTNSQFWPRLKVDPTTGIVAVSWYDARNDPGSGPGDTDGTANTDTELFATVSYNGGVTFQPNQQIAAGPSNAISNPNSGNEYGDYSGLAFYGGNFYPAWADNSNSTGNNPDGKLSGFDILTAKVVVPPAPPPPPPSSGGGGGTSVAGDKYEPNDTSDQATQFGTLTVSQSFTGLTIDRHPNGFYDQDWYTWTASAGGTFTAALSNIQAGGGDIHVRLFRELSDGTLLDLADGTGLGGRSSQSASAAVNAGDQMFVWVYGFNFATGSYDMSVSIA